MIELSNSSSLQMATTMRELSNVIRDDDDDEVWVTHYSSNHQMLLVGEGDFSFSCSLATRFGSASNIIASSLDSYDDVVRKYKNARSNLETLKRLGAILLHGVDATRLQLHPDLNRRRYDRVIFNFPHAGFHSKESDPYLIQKHRNLVFGFFHGASRMLRADGQVHVSHKNKAPFCDWNLEELASKCSLVLVQCAAFEKSMYPGYENKRGDGSRCDQPFLLGECTTFKFRVSRVAKELYAEKLKSKFLSNKHPLSFDLERSLSFEGVSQRPPVSFDLSFHHDHNLRQLQDHLFQSRQRTSPLDLGYYQEHRFSQFEDASSIRATQRPASVAHEKNHAWFQDNSVQLEMLRYTERSSSQFHDFPLQASHHRHERFLECSSRYNEASPDIYNTGIQSMLTRTSFPHPYTGESPERRRLLCQDFKLQAGQEPIYGRSNYFSEGTREIYNGDGRRMLTHTSFPHRYIEESQERGLANPLNIYPPHHCWLSTDSSKLEMISVMDI
ncbi:unnamed protein product [Thlaspi arvense]|uniref:25S rRNA (uridine-N(3))-methyltransferase BMT5-like domain-containing protein n=1 Tax=Thlaspi arvense TaxID=13288 RepID=A0AAU9R3Q8_THLAR|nr:unnamed protein product [Thlaspi arvense]